jgi:hypothetical protein
MARQINSARCDRDSGGFLNGVVILGDIALVEL